MFSSMSKAEPYGYQIIPVSLKEQTKYEVLDLSTKKVVFSFDIQGTLSPIFEMYDTNKKEVLISKKASNWVGVYRMFKGDRKFATLDYSIDGCSSKIELYVGTRTYLGNKVKETAIEFVNDVGNPSFIFRRKVSSSESEYLVVIYDSIEPEVALMSSVIIETAIQAQ